MQRLLVTVAVCAAALRAETVLVVPFFNHSRNASLDWIRESIAEAVADALASHDILVLDRADRLEGFRRLSLRPGAELTHASIMKLGEALDAARVVYGQYEVSEAEPSTPAKPARESLRIAARILDLRRLRQG